MKTEAEKTTGAKPSSLSTEKIWEEFSDRLRKFVYSKVPDKSIVDDIIQDIFYKIHLNIHDLRNNSNTGSWSFQIARNAITDYFRNEKKARQLLENMKEEENYIKNTSTEILRFCMVFFLSRLPKKYEDALIFTEFEGNSQVELSKKENISVSAAKSRVQRAKKQLKEIISQYSFFEIKKGNIDISEIGDYCPLKKS